MEHELPPVATLLAELRALATLPAADGRRRQAIAAHVLALPSADLLELVRQEAAANPALEVVERRRWSRHAPRAALAPRAARSVRASMPDVVISRENGTASQRGFAFQITESERFGMRLRPLWLRRQLQAGDPRAALTDQERQDARECVARARLLVALIHERWQKLARLTECLIELQWDVLQRGTNCLIPLARAAVAFRAAMQDATLGRAIASKHVQLPTGLVVPFSRFFQFDSTVLAAIRDLVRRETVPLTDVQLAETLLLRDIVVTPGTVAEYRLQAGILPPERRGRPVAPPLRPAAPRPASMRRLRPLPPMTAEEVAAALAAAARAAAEKQEADRLAAARAEELLRDVLSARERTQLARSGYLDVPSPGYPERFYRIPRHLGRVRLFEQGRAVCELCIVPIAALPAADVIVMHRLMIQGDEESYLRTANRFPVYVPPPTAAPAVLPPLDPQLPPDPFGGFNPFARL